MFVRQRRKFSLEVTVILDENEVPDFDHIRVVGVDQGAAGQVVRAVVVQLRTRPARPGVTHGPEVVLFAAGVDLLVRQMLEPELTRLRIRFQTFLFVAFEIGSVQPLGVQLHNIDQKFPRPVDSLFLEIITE